MTDVDLDCAEAIHIASYVLPPTKSMFGRPSAHASHRLYKTELASQIDAATILFSDPKREKDNLILELRIGGKGAQTVFPGSIHDETGEPIQWVEDKEPATVDGNELRKRVALLASGCLLARYWPAEGLRHAAALTVGGFLARAGIEQRLVTPLIRGICAVADDRELKDRVTASEVREGVNVPGYASARRHHRSSRLARR